MNLGEARVGKTGPAFIGPEGGGDIGGHGIGGKEKHIAVPAGAQHHGIGAVGFQFARHQVAHHDAAGLAAHHDHI